jgi:deoxyribose-phosphate aldolase
MKEKIMNRNKYIDHTLLKPEATEADILKLCREAADYDFASVCVNPGWVKTAAEALKGTDVNVCTVIGFPLGATSKESKVFEAQQAVKDGAKEVDMVINVGRLKAHDDAYVIDEIRAIKEAAGVLEKVIIEACLLSDEEKVRACEDAEKGGADFVKTSTGFSTGGATVHDVELMKKTVGDRLKVKASGGIRTKEEMDAMIAAGADRIGTSHGIELM